MDDIIDPKDLLAMKETPYEWLSKATDADLRSMVKENVLSGIIFGVYFYSVYKMVVISSVDPTQLWAWFWGFAAQVSIFMTIAWVIMIRLKGGSDVWEVDFYRPDGYRASGTMILDGQPHTLNIEYLRDSIQKLREEYARIKEQRVKLYPATEET